ncbi:uroporphyrinogen-III synthase, chloroplastic-like [Rosa rugosa]|uniref:uroporphyrinogen-III synthase, chloroplastic-like n=1 Tax=Rosa rugosa TaxID=74645 RepID=UPI002B400A16|nr:uroporphyrinogen-III synthase, chloroplastic-like [Rosa rugosa]
MMLMAMMRILVCTRGKFYLLSMLPNGLPGTPSVKVGVVGAGTTSVFEEVLQSSKKSLSLVFVPSKATAKVLASELPKNRKDKGKVLYPASAKAGNEIDMVIRS